MPMGIHIQQPTMRFRNNRESTVAHSHTLFARGSIRKPKTSVDFVSSTQSATNKQMHPDLCGVSVSRQV
ncbi:uncharacterized protein EAF01_007820 [Botrytis porri]|uniref:uncharacterized protein n=1 Tax=Botrytis porri TaxID=87229 RepID=UPI00190174BF|nr:uncharacterized protein EAF01_007820 [Botrytis porri]KAF7900518.1 hypothetical protein EAF01_007820 [Botrytis porri]